MARSTSSSQALVEEAQERRKERLKEQKSGDVDLELQYKALTKTNEIMAAKISEMENRISDLINENIQLRQNSPHINIIQSLELKLVTLESALNLKLEEMMKVLTDFKHSEGLQHKPYGSSLKFHNSNITSRPKRRYSFTVKKNRLQVFNDELSLSQPITKQDYNNIDATPELNNVLDIAKAQTQMVRPTELTSETQNEKIQQLQSQSQSQTNVKSKQKTQPKTKQKPSLSLDLIKSQNMPPTMENKRISRRKSQINYSEPSLRKKLRRDRPTLIDAVTEGNYKTLIKNERIPLAIVDDNKPKGLNNKEMKDIMD